MYYSYDRTCSSVIAIISCIALSVSISLTYLILHYLSLDTCLVLKILNLTDSKIVDIAFLVNTTFHSIEIAYGSDYYSVGTEYPCLRIMDITILDNKQSYILASQGLTVVLSIMVTCTTIGVLAWLTNVYIKSKEYAYLK